jgi:hypothetical protein
MLEIVDSILDFLGEHPLLTVAIFIVLFMGGCEVAVKIHIVSSSTKLMPY